MPIFIKHKRQLWTRLPLGVLGIVVFALSPLIVGLIGAYFTVLITGVPCHEGNCTWGALPWFIFVTIPIGVVCLVIYIIIAVIDGIQLYRHQ